MPRSKMVKPYKFNIESGFVRSVRFVICEFIRVYGYAELLKLVNVLRYEEMVNDN